MTEFHANTAAFAQRSDLLRLGIDGRAIARAKTSGSLLPLRRGAYLRRVHDGAPNGIDGHALLVAATMPRLGDGAVVRHASAAVFHGISVWPGPTNRVHVTKARPGGGRRSRTLHLHVAALADDDIVRISG